MIVMDPDQISVLNVFCNGRGKELIGLLVCLPGLLIEGDLSRMVVEQWPQDGIFQCSVRMSNMRKVYYRLEKPL